MVSGHRSRARRSASDAMRQRATHPPVSSLRLSWRRQVPRAEPHAEPVAEVLLASARRAHWAPWHGSGSASCGQRDAAAAGHNQPVSDVKPESDQSPFSDERRAERSDELARNLADVRSEIAAAAIAANRDPASVSLVVVTKHWPAADVAALAALGVSQVGENRVQELTAKRTALAPLTSCQSLSWHLIGALQTNKAKAALLAADVIESVDRVKLVTALEQAAAQQDCSVDCLVQVSLDPEPTAGRAGVAPRDAGQLTDLIASGDRLRLRGVMGVAPNGGDARAAFEKLASISAEVQRNHPAATDISAGMSSDFREAIAAGATHVRIGTAVLGNRQTLR